MGVALKNNFFELLSNMLQVGESFHLISDEIARWRDILVIPHQEYLPNK